MPEIVAVVIIALALAVLLYGVMHRVPIEVNVPAPITATPGPSCALTLDGVTIPIPCDPSGPLYCATPFGAPVCEVLTTPAATMLQ